MSQRAAEWLKRERTRAGYGKQATVARGLQVARSTVANWEAGRGAPSPATVPILATLLGVPQSEIADVFEIRLTGDLPAPEPAWAQELLTEMRAIRRLLQRQTKPAPELTLDQIVSAVGSVVDQRLAAGPATGSRTPGDTGARRRKAAPRVGAAR